MVPNKSGVIAILQARMSSSRLPGKVLKSLLGKPMIQHQIERLSASKEISRLIIATSTHVSDDPILAFCGDIGISCFRGSLEDVLDRYYEAASLFEGHHIMRLTADCPLIDPDVLDALVALYFGGEYDYASNTLRRTYPKGLDAEIIKYEVLGAAHHEAKDTFDREHVTPFIIRHPSRFRAGNLENETDLSDFRWTVDWQEDFEFVREIYNSLYEDNPEFRTADIVALQERRPDLARVLCPISERPNR